MNGLRQFLSCLAASCVLMSEFVGAQPSPRMPRIGYLGNSSPSLEPDLVQAFGQGLRDLGYVEGKTIAIEYRWAEGDNSRLPALAADLIRLKVDVIVAAGTPGIVAAKQATKTIPIVMAVAGDAVGAGLVASLAKPGGNVTGLTTIIPDLEGKRLELLRQVVPKLSRVGVLMNPANGSTPGIFKQTRASAQALGVAVQALEVRAAENFAGAFETLERRPPDALVILGDRFLLAHRARIVAEAAKLNLPLMSPYSEFVIDGGLMSYGPSYTESFRRCATYVDKILKGARPSDLPVEQPTTLDLVINRKTARRLGLTIPPDVLVLANKVIE